MWFPAPIRGALVVCAGVFAVVRPASAETIAVPAGGDLQAALNAAAPGDVITLVPGATYAGNFVLPNKGALSSYITIRSAAPDSSLPPAGVRMTPAYAAYLPRIRSSNTGTAMRTAPGANHWKLMFLEFGANVGGYGEILSLGMGDTSQTMLSQVPSSIVIDRIYMHGDPINGQKRGIGLNSSDTTIVNSYIVDMKGVGQDTQAVGGYNGPGNYVIENNYLEGAGENFILGGADPKILNLVTTNVTFRRNHLKKPLAWRDPILAAPANVAAAVAPAGGSLPAGTYYYRVVAKGPTGQGNKATSAASAEVSATVAAGTVAGVTVSWTPVVNATEYYVYGRAAGAENMYWKTTTPYFTDMGAAGTAGTPPTGAGTKWTVKNIFELKNAQDVLVEGNVFENNWVADQPGYPIVFTPRNQDGGAPWVVVQRVMFRNNLVRHSAGGINILGHDNLAPSQQTNSLTIVHNVFDDIGTAWGSGSRMFLIGDGADRITIDHNTIDTTTSMIVAVYGGTTTSPVPTTNFVYTNNMSQHGTYGIFGNGMSTGNVTIAAYFPGSVITRNVLAGGSASKYPAGNFFPTVAAWQADFVDFAGADYHLLAASVFNDAGTDGTDLGASVDTVMMQAASALSGDTRTMAGITPVRITTTALPDADLNQSYSQPVTCTGGSAPCAWLVVDSTLPAGIAFDAKSGIAAGVPTAVETGALTVTAYDPASPGNNATVTLTVTVNPPPFVVTVPAPAEGRVGAAYELQPSASGAIGPVEWSVSSGALPVGVSLDKSSGAVGGVPSAWGTSTAMLEAHDLWQEGRIGSGAATITIDPEPLQVTTMALANGTYNQFYSTLLSVTGGTGATAWALVGGSLPTGVNLDPSGTISGTPSTVGTFSVTIEATDLGWTVNRARTTLSLTVDAPAFTISVPPAGAGSVGVWYQLAASAAGQIGSVAWSIASGTLPPGLTLNAASGLIAGVPTMPGTFSATIRAQDSWSASRVATATVTIAIAPSSLAIATTSLPAAAVQQPYQAILSATGGSGQTIWSIAAGSLPPGLQLNTNGAIFGVPASAGTFTFTVRAVDAAWPSNTATGAVTIAVGAREAVMYAVDAAIATGTWSLVDDATAAAGKRLSNPNLNVPKLAAPYASPSSYFEITFQAEAGVPYHLWVRGKAVADYYGNDSAFVQFSGAVTATGAPVNRIGTTSALVVSVEDGSGAGLSGWGWGDDSYSGFGSAIYFETTGSQTIRVQVREDGLSIDQIVLSADKYAGAAPGPAKNDTTIVSR